MKRRTALVTAASGVTTLTAGCLGRLPVVGSSVDASIDLVDAELEVEDDPDVSVDGETVTASGTIAYGSSACGTVELAHAEYEPSQDRLDVLVVAADDTSWFTLSCTDDLVYAGYELEATVRGGFRRVSVTEHHVFGETYSTTVDGL
ncbi:hypothetical protein AB7C87_03135 [Natrarchaeobius sp. A-rgal3]|uniref:hypothetical protein n=1 Tax=Natrarchaeobius versutus TaxID=1679078 RepID=UPI00351038D8